MIEVKKYALRQSRDGTIISFVLHPHDDSTDLVTAPIGAVFNISYEVANGDESSVVVVSLDTEQRGNHPNRVKSDSRTLGERIRTRAVLLCKDERFQEWVFDCVFAVRDPKTNELKRPSTDRTAEWLRDELRILSRSELATNEEAQKRFLELERRYREETGQVAEARG